MRSETLVRASRAWLGHLLEESGVELDGPLPWHPQVRRPRCCARIVLSGTLGAGESYVDGDWDCEALDKLSATLVRQRLDSALGTGLSDLGRVALSRLLNRQSIVRAAVNGHSHYDDREDLYEAMLDPTMTYSCGYWRSAHTLEEAQIAKLHLVCQKLGLQPGQRVLDIGCGWGSFARYAAERYGVQVVGITVSDSQATRARRVCQGLPVEIRLQDYRDVHERFDRVVSMGMFEHVGPRNYRAYMQRVRDSLRSGGLFLLHTIGALQSSSVIDPWMDRYIFPGAVLPSVREIAAAMQGLFVLEDWHSFGADYDRTLMSWYRNFEQAWPSLRANYGERFFRTWRYYLLTCAGVFRARSTQLWQIVLAKSGVHGGYHRPLE